MNSRIIYAVVTCVPMMTSLAPQPSETLIISSPADQFLSELDTSAAISIICGDD
ncbi:hypothetical protein HGT73_03570 [Rosenbergiella australiborealis]|uniref:Uncharacterized protein n=1 Tax=Rosenbergiella australiborealis TaxID=1544696 RepID=A0ABS5T283_9GAMM|nr:hypothetical protein [Rosenbergiella australiborealis]MBT0726469.1 hypothetical protein [Rosenbergiella australiborealis]